MDDYIVRQVDRLRFWSNEKRNAKDQAGLIHADNEYRIIFVSIKEYTGWTDWEIWQKELSS